METGKGVGGPRDGIKLSAMDDWDGRIRDYRGQADDSTIRKYYPGHYVWIAIDGTWLWVVDDSQRKPSLLGMDFAYGAQNNTQYRRPNA